MFKKAILGIKNIVVILYKNFLNFLLMENVGRDSSIVYIGGKNRRRVCIHASRLFKSYKISHLDLKNRISNIHKEIFEKYHVEPPTWRLNQIFCDNNLNSIKKRIVIQLQNDTPTLTSLNFHSDLLLSEVTKLVRKI